MANVDKMRNISVNKTRKNNDHPNLVKIEECFQNKRYLYVISQLITGEDLFTRLNKLYESNDINAECQIS